MTRKVTVVGGAGNVGATVARAVADKQLADVVIIDIADQKARGNALDISKRAQSRGTTRASSGREPTSRLEGDGEFGCRRHHRRPPAQAGHEPRRPSEDQLRNRAGGHRAGRQVLAQHASSCGRESARRDVPGRLSAEQVPERPRHRHGRRARLGAHAHLHRDGTERVRRERPCLRARRPRRHDGAAAAVLDRRRHPDHRAPVGGADRRDLEAHGRRRRRDRRAGRHERLLRAAPRPRRWSRPS